jgi:hypothetical protein
MYQTDGLKPYQLAWLVFAGLVLLVGTGVMVRLCGIADTKYLGTIDQNAQREVYENTKAYRDGVRRDFDELRLGYMNAKTPEDKATVLSIVRHRAEGVPPELVPDDIKKMLGGAP